MALCMSEKDFPCRSATFSVATGECRISDMDRHTVAGTTAFTESLGDEYLENNCVDDPVKLCDFQLLENRIMKTVDSVYQDVPTMEACRDLCLTAPYRCHSFDYADTGDRVCRLSHHTSTTLTQIQDPFLVIGDVRGTFELSSCYNVTIDCRSSDMVATITTNKIFTGKIYAKDNPNSCVVDVDGDIEFSISMAYNDLECNVKREALGVYTNQVIIQHHDSVVTSSDLGLALHCQYDLGNKSVTNELDLEVQGEISPALIEQGTVESPTVVMSVTARGGGRVERAQVGDPLELHFTILDLEVLFLQLLLSLFFICSHRTRYLSESSSLRTEMTKTRSCCWTPTVVQQRVRSWGRWLKARRGRRRISLQTSMPSNSPAQRWFSSGPSSPLACHVANQWNACTRTSMAGTTQGSPVMGNVNAERSGRALFVPSMERTHLRGGAGGGASEEQKLLSERKCW